MSDLSGDRFHGLELNLRRLSGAAAIRVIHPGGQVIGAHTHDWPYLALHRLGGYRERFDGGEAWIEGPSAVFHPSGAQHEDEIGEAGLETVTIEFDPAWIGRRVRPIRRSRVRLGGAAARAAPKLVALWSEATTPEASLRSATAAFLRLVEQPQPTSPEPPWLAHVRQTLEAPSGVRTAELARLLHLHPAYLSRAYRERTGEGMHETARRRRVERAVALLRTTDSALADVAAATGFCDQAHMTRVFRTALGRTPVTVRQERLRLRAFSRAT